MGFLDDIGDAAQDAVDAGRDAAESGADSVSDAFSGDDDSGGSSDSGGTFVDTIDQQESGSDVTVGGSDYDTPSDQPDAPSSGSSSSSSGGGGGDTVTIGDTTYSQGPDGGLVEETDTTGSVDEVLDETAGTTGVDAPSGSSGRESVQDYGGQGTVENPVAQPDDSGGSVVDRGRNWVGERADDASNAFDDFQERADEELRDRTGGDIGVSDDFTSSDDSGGVRGVVDEGINQVTGGEAGLSDDFTSTDDYFDGAEFNRDLAVDLSRGGFLSENPNDNTGILPGEIGGFDISEDRFRGAAEWGDKQKAEFDEGGDFLGSSRAESALQGAAGMGVDFLNVPQHVLTAEGAAETAQSTPGAIQEHGAGSYAQTATIFGRDMGQSMVDEAQADPIEFGSGAIFGYATGAAAGRAAGKTGRMVRDRARTAGGTKIDSGDLADDDVIRNVDTDGAEGKRFPDADDPDTYQTDPAEAVREQADANTPDAVDVFFDNQGVGEGTTMKKALDVEPDGPGTGRSDTGFSSAPDEVGGDFDYETPGSFFGPELSPNFLRVDGGEASFSPMPGLPDMGNKPTGVLARTDVENPDADTLEGFNQEIMDNVGDTTAYTKPADEVNVGEIEAVVPPGGEFAPVSGGGVFSDLGRRAGVGSDFYTEVGGRRVPLRTVAPADKTPDADGGGGGLFGGPDGDTSPSGESLDYYVDAPEQAVDRPLPMGLPGAEGASEPATSTQTETDPGYDTEPGYEPMDTGYDPAPVDPEPTTRPPSSDSGRPSDRDSGASSPAGGDSSPGLFGGSESSTPSPSDEPSSPGGSPSPPERGGPTLPGPSSPPADRGEPTIPGVGSPPSDGGGSDPPGGGSPFGGYGPFGGVPTESPPSQRPRPPRFGDENNPDDRKRREEEFPEPESPEYTNPIASGTDMLFGGGAFGEPTETGASENGTDETDGENWGGGLFY